MLAHVDLFAGAGGWEVGAARLGLSFLGVENDPDACATREAVGLETLRADVSELAPMPCEGFVASPPCQAWSRAGKRLGEKDKPLVWEALDALAEGQDARADLWPRCRDARSLLVVEPLRWALALMPEWIALEQVPDVLEVWERVAAVLSKRGYRVWTGVLNAANYGVPQTRERAILIASREHPTGPPPPSHSDQRRGGDLLGLVPWMSMADALGWDGDLDTNRDQREDGQRQQVEADRPAPAFTGKSGGQWKHRPATTLTTTRRSTRGLLVGRQLPEGEAVNVGGWKWRNGNQDHAAERSPDEPAPTLHFGNAVNDVKWVRERLATTVQATPRIGRPGHKAREAGEAQFAHDAVAVSVEEAAILQDFPADYPWQGTKSSVFRQIGNAIPPGLALAILREATGVKEPHAA